MLVELFLKDRDICRAGRYHEWKQGFHAHQTIEDCNVLPMTNLDLRLLKVFRAIVANGGLKGAATMLNVGLPTISKQLSDLEIRLGMRLCNRGGSKFELTEEGTAIYQASKQLFASIEDFRTNVGKLKKKKKQVLRIAAIDNLITDRNSPLPWLIGYFDARNCHVSVIISRPDEIEKGVRDNIFDIGITPIYQQDADLKYAALYDEISYLYCGDQHPFYEIDDEELEHHRVDAEPCVKHLYVDKRFIPALKNQPGEGAEALQAEAVLTLILSGKYLGFLPAHFASAFENSHQIRKLHQARRWYSTEIGFVYRREGTLNTTVLQAINLLKNRASQDVSVS
ncbi:LysR family transcriptional regulator [Brucella sp. BE17]|uniref:LysR family transcriptional regulator n=1 Tax=Brucella sp. BE17 TaxID=3142977 RepID=UPI0031BA1910